MEQTTYELDRPVGKFDEGDVFRVTARFGSGFLNDVRLEPVDEHTTGSLEFTDEQLKTVASVPDSGTDRIPTRMRVS